MREEQPIILEIREDGSILLQSHDVYSRTFSDFASGMGEGRQIVYAERRDNPPLKDDAKKKSLQEEVNYAHFGVTRSGNLRIGYVRPDNPARVWDAGYVVGQTYNACSLDEAVAKNPSLVEIDPGINGREFLHFTFDHYKHLWQQRFTDRKIVVYQPLGTKTEEEKE